MNVYMYIRIYHPLSGPPIDGHLTVTPYVVFQSKISDADVTDGRVYTHIRIYPGGQRARHVLCKSFFLFVVLFVHDESNEHSANDIIFQVPKGPQLKIQNACRKKLEELGVDATKAKKSGSPYDKDNAELSGGKGDAEGHCGICWEGEVQVCTHNESQGGRDKYSDHVMHACMHLRSPFRMRLESLGEGMPMVLRYI